MADNGFLNALSSLKGIIKLMKNYYKTLNVPFDADLTTIKKSYRQLALRYHPDKNKSSDGGKLKKTDLNQNRYKNGKQ